MDLPPLVMTGDPVQDRAASVARAQAILAANADLVEQYVIKHTKNLQWTEHQIIDTIQRLRSPVPPSTLHAWIDRQSAIRLIPSNRIPPGMAMLPVEQLPPAVAEQAREAERHRKVVNALLYVRAHHLPGGWRSRGPMPWTFKLHLIVMLILIVGLTYFIAFIAPTPRSHPKPRCRRALLTPP